ncbi:MAG: type II 3-dehydroquinate dehydratase [Mycobacteriales bacterium]
MKILVLHGPNLNLLGDREPEVYGHLSLAEVDRRIAARAAELGMELRIRQSNIEGELVTELQQARDWGHGIVINPGGYSHTSVAIRDAIAAVRLPAVEVHLSNPAAREDFRRTDLVGGVCTGVIAGFGWRSYVLALEALSSIGVD